MSRSVKIVSVVLLLLVIVIFGGCSMQNKTVDGTAVKYPVKPITVMVPYSAGGMTDIMTRAMEKFAVKYFEQPFIIVNKPGGAGTIAWNELVKDKPDGYVVGVMTYSAILQPIYGQSKYNYSTALDPIAQFTNPPMVLSVLSNSKYKTLEELVRYAKDHPGEVKFGHGGLGAGSHVLVEMFAKEADIKIEQVPFQGSAESIAALLGGHIDMIVSGTPELREYIKSNQIKPIAVTGGHRLNDPGFYDVPTFKEQGFNDAINNFHCIVAPKEIPPEIKSKLVLCFKSIINDPEYQAAMRELGVEAEYMGPEDCIKAWTFDSQMLTKVVHETGVFEKIAAQKK